MRRIAIAGRHHWLAVVAGDNTEGPLLSILAGLEQWAVVSRAFSSRLQPDYKPSCALPNVFPQHVGLLPSVVPPSAWRHALYRP